MSRDEIAVLDGSKCVLQLRGVRPFLSDKYDLTQHPNYKYSRKCIPETMSCESLNTNPIADSCYFTIYTTVL